MTSITAAIHSPELMNAAGDAAGGAGTGEPSTISANDFLTLLVTEMENQDPTAQTDPNQYINQLVQVNSLEQLIQINQNLSTVLGVPTTDSSSGDRGSTFTASAPPTVISTPNSRMHGLPAGGGHDIKAQPPVHKVLECSGNLSVPKPNAAAERVARALSGR
jgi:flagellar basal-body rod modification protein FlgD